MNSRTVPRSLAALALALICSGAAAVDVPPALGWLEWSRLMPQGVRVKTKLDTGARTSSLDAAEVVPFERDGQLHVRFRVPVTPRPEDFDIAHDLVLERPVVREVRIKKHRGKSDRRYVVRLDLCLDGESFETPVSLTDRSRFNYPLLLGRSALAGRAVVDASRKFVADGECGAGASGHSVGHVEDGP